MAEKLIPFQAVVSAEEEQLASILQEAGLLSPLLAASTAQVAKEAKEQKKMSGNSSLEDFPMRAALRASFPHASEQELDDLELSF